MPQDQNEKWAKFEEAFAQTLRLSHGAVASKIYRLGMWQDAMDCLQDAALKCLTDGLLTENMEPGAARELLFRAASQVAHDRRQTLRRRRRRLLERQALSKQQQERLEDLLDIDPCVTDEPSTLLISKESTRQVLEAVAQLPPPRDEIVRLHCLEKLTFQKISARLHMNLSTVHSNYIAAKVYLEKVLKRGDL
ncbi:MAG: RNA polymerase sigma factor [Phycisphaerae bacterium]